MNKAVSRLQLERFWFTVPQLSWSLGDNIWIQVHPIVHIFLCEEMTINYITVNHHNVIVKSINSSR